MIKTVYVPQVVSVAEGLLGDIDADDLRTYTFKQPKLFEDIADAVKYINDELDDLASALGEPTPAVVHEDFILRSVPEGPHWQLKLDRLEEEYGHSVEVRIWICSIKFA